MNYLMDTHTFLWAMIEPDKLSPLVKQILENPENSIHISAITFWEISLKFSLGKLKLNGVQPNEFPELSRQTGFKSIPLSTDESASYNKLKLTDHRDPFDRMLIWQSISKNFIFITKEEKINQNYSSMGLKTIWH